jgi:hypothetical protein
MNELTMNDVTRSHEWLLLERRAREQEQQIGALTACIGNLTQRIQELELHTGSLDDRLTRHQEREPNWRER